MANGDWEKSNVADYLTCEEYDGENTPKRYGLMLRKTFEQVTS